MPDRGDVSVMLAMTTVGHVSAQSAVAYARVLGRLVKEGIEAEPAMSHIVDVASARRRLVETALDGGFTHILWLDGDTLLDPGQALLLLGDRDQCRVVGGLCRRRSAPYPPVVFGISGSGRFLPKFDFASDGLTRVGSPGHGCLLAECDVYREMSKYHGDDLWYVFGPELGEDTWFFRRLYQMGETAWLDGRVRCGHETSVVIDAGDGWVPSGLLEDGLTETAETYK